MRVSPAATAALERAHESVDRRSITDPWVVPDDETIATVIGATRAVVLAGPGVVAEGAIAGLHAFAAVVGLGVANTWGAKGVYDWRSRHHWGTVGLQARDFELVGFADADLVVATGVDEREAPPAAWADRAAATLTVPPRALSALAEAWTGTRGSPDYPPLRDALLPVSAAGWESDAVPMPPTRVTRNYALAWGGCGVLTADAGIPGFWVARTYTTVSPETVYVAPEVIADYAVACAFVSRQRDGRPALAVTDAPLSDSAREILELADARGLPIAVEQWDDDGDAIDADAHAQRLATLAAADRSSVVSIRTDPRQLDAMVAAGGPLVAWSGAVSVP